MSYQDTHTIEIAGKEFICDVRFSALPIIPATGPSFYSGGEPESGGDVEIISARLHVDVWPNKVEYVEAPAWLIAAMQEDEDLLERLFDGARDEIYGEPDPDAAYEAMRDERDAA